MIGSLMVSYLWDGELPIYQADPPGIGQHVLTDDMHWLPVLSRRLITPLIDRHLTDFEREIPQIVGSAQNLSRQHGTLICAVRTLIREATHTFEPFIVMGMGFIEQEGVGIGLSLGSANPIDVLLSLIRNQEHPLLEDFRRVDRSRRSEQEALHAKHQEASIRAKRLLFEFLTPEQRAEFEAHQRFHVVGQNGNLYRINMKRAHNVFQIRDGRAVVEYCVVHKNSDIPVCDQMLSQKLLLEANIREFLRIANHWELTENLQHRAEMNDFERALNAVG